MFHKLHRTVISLQMPVHQLLVFFEIMMASLVCVQKNSKGLGFIWEFGVFFPLKWRKMFDKMIWELFTNMSNL